MGRGGGRGGPVLSSVHQLLLYKDVGGSKGGRGPRRRPHFLLEIESIQHKRPAILVFSLSLSACPI
jgi:hypothetical protein